MPLATAQDITTLNSWGFRDSYNKNRNNFIDVVRIVYRTLTEHTGRPPNNPGDIVNILATSLQSSNIFLRMVSRSPYMSPILYPAIASAMARYILDDAWHTIINDKEA